MNVKAIGAIAVVVSTSTLLAILTLPFPGWEEVKEKSPDIILARCVKSPDNPSNSLRGLIESDIEVLGVLKGRTNITTAPVRSLYWPQPEDRYLIFANFHDGLYDAIETYRFVPLGRSFTTNRLSGKTLDQKIHTLFQSRLDDLNRQLGELQEEKGRLEKGLGISRSAP